MRKVVELLTIIAAFLLQCTFFQAFSFAGIVPNLLIFLASAFGFMGGPREGMFAGFVSGLLMDLFYAPFVGLNALIFLYIGYVNGLANRLFYPEDIKFPIFCISLSDISVLLLQYIFGFLLRARLDLPYYVGHVMIPELSYTIVMALILYRPLLALNGLIYRHDPGDSSGDF